MSGKGRICRVEGCDTPVRLNRRGWSTNWCEAHTVGERFWAFVTGGDFTECWIWTGTTHYKGYGRFQLHGRNVASHRWSYEAMIAPIPEGLHLDHLCRNPSCVNPWHLEPVTNRVNAQRGNVGQPQRAQAAERKTCSNGHPWTEETTYIGTSSSSGRPYRRCRVCHRVKNGRRRPCPECGEAVTNLARHVRVNHKERAA